MAKAKEKADSHYFSEPSGDIEFISSGCTLLDCVLGGGWAAGRIANVIGDKSTGKTLLAIETCANFHLKYPKGKIYYAEVESAFDQNYARSLGMPVDAIDFPEDIITVENFFYSVEKAIEAQEGSDEPALYILDSLDALTDEAEMDRTLDKGSYGMTKAKQMSQIFRRITTPLSKSKICLIIISQTRQNIGVTFGKKYTRSGGTSLDFYASQIIYLAHIKSLKRTIKGIERVHSVEVKARTDKNKVGLPFRDCQFTIKFGYGVDDLKANVDFIQSIGAEDELGIPAGDLKKMMRNTDNIPDEEFYALNEKAKEIVQRQWVEIEKGFLPKRSKYG